MNTLSFDVNNGRKMELIQGEHDGFVSILITDANGNMEKFNSQESFIEPGEMVMLINYFRNCRNGTEKSDYIRKWGE